MNTWPSNEYEYEYKHNNDVFSVITNTLTVFRYIFDTFQFVSLVTSEMHHVSCNITIFWTTCFDRVHCSMSK